MKNYWLEAKLEREDIEYFKNMIFGERIYSPIFGERDWDFDFAFDKILKHEHHGIQIQSMSGSYSLVEEI